MAEATGPVGRSADEPPAIELRGVAKSFGNVRANHDINLSVPSGTIHGIIGENGAGKSTLMNILYGLHRADQGEILIDGRQAAIRSSADAIAEKIGMVHQHFMLVPNFNILDNMMLGSEGGLLLANGREDTLRSLTQLAAEYDMDIDLENDVGDQPVGRQQRVEILKALKGGARILILDEPTGVLTPQEADSLFRMLRTLKKSGVTVLLITHKLEEIMAITDNVSIMRQGTMVGHRETSSTTPEELAELMVGRKVLLRVDRGTSQPGDICLEVERLSCVSASGAKLLNDISFAVRAGEVLGVAGVAGNGQSELLEALAGMRKPSRGSVAVLGEHLNADKTISPAGMRALRLAHIPEDRHKHGLILGFEAAENVVLGYHRHDQCGAGRLFDRNAVAAHCAALMQAYDVRPANPGLPARNFSGGNQQKLVIARELAAAPRVLIVGQPTRGVDIGAIEFIHKQLIALRDNGCAILLVSVELDEVLGLSDRIMVMNNGRQVGIVDRDQADEQTLGLMMAGIARGGSGVSAPPLPRWADIFLLPAINLLAALVVCGLIVLSIGENPITALGVMIKGAFVFPGSLGYTLYYTTNFVYTGLAVAVAFHAMMFNIGGEGQAYLGGLGAGLVSLWLAPSMPAIMVLPLAVAGAALFGAAWGFIPGYLQAKRGSHIVITTIMFNFIAASLMVWLLAGALIEPGQMSPQTPKFATAGQLPSMQSVFATFGVELANSPLNLSFVIALIALFAFWLLIWRTRLGYEIRAIGQNPDAAHYAGINVPRVIIITLAVSGGLAGLMATNEVLGVQHRVVLNFTAGYGFTGIAVALMGRNHPVGIFLASLLFGALYQGGAELDFEFQSITREMVLLIQGMIILFSGALAYMFNPPLARLIAALTMKKEPARV